MKNKTNSRKMEQTRLLIRSIFSFIMLFLLSFLIGGGILYLTGLLFWSRELREKYEIPNLGIGVLFCASVFLIYQMVRSLFQSYKTETKSMRLLSSEEMPQLFNMIDEVAAFMKTASPQRVYLSSSVTASVFLGTSSTLFFSPRRKRLEIGVGMINILTIEELRAAIAHEMGHFSQRSMFLGGYVYSIEQAVHFISRQIDFKKKGLWEQQMKGLFSIFHVFAQLLFQRLYCRFQDFSLELEYDADRLAAECVGVTTLRSALLKTAFASKIYEDTITILGNWAIHGKSVQDIYTAHRYTMDGYLASFGEGRRFSEKLWREPVNRAMLSPTIESRLKRLEDSSINEDINARLPREYIPTLRLFNDIFTKHIYSELYGKDINGLDECRLFTYRKWVNDYYLWLSGQKSEMQERVLCINLPAKLHRLPLVDVKLEVYVDKKQIGTGSFKKGMSVSVPVLVGKHRVSVICWGNCFMDQAIVVEENVSHLTLNLDYKVKLRSGQYNFFIVSGR